MNLLDILTPLYLLITLGFILKKLQFPSNEFWPGLERMIYFILFPTLIFVALIKAPIDLSLLIKVIIVISIPSVLSGLFQWLGFISPHLSGATFSSMFQGSIRNNTAISLVIAAWIVPDRGLALMAVIILIMVPLNNLTSILVLLRYGKPEVAVSPRWWLGIVKNPLIIACAVGLTFNMLAISPLKR